MFGQFSVDELDRTLSSRDIQLGAACATVSRLSVTVAARLPAVLA